MNQSRRIAHFDAVRGIAMLAVCLSHSAALVANDNYLYSGLKTLGMVATPSFLLLSGVICSYMQGSSRATDLRRQWLDRGLFMLLVGHLWVGATLTITARIPLSQALFDSVYITDATGVALILAAFGLTNASKSTLASCGVALSIGAGILSHYIRPHSIVASGLENALVGTSTRVFSHGYEVPIVPYVGIFMIGLAGGKHYLDLLARKTDVRTIARGCILVGTALMLLAVVVKLAWFGLHTYLPPALQDVAHDFTAFRQKLPPSLNYLLTYGGAAIIITGLVASSSPHGRSARVVAMFADVGRASFFIFVLQFWLYYFPAIAMRIGPMSGLGLGVVLCASWYVLWIAAKSWSRIEGNRFFTVGLRHRTRLIQHARVINVNGRRDRS